MDPITVAMVFQALDLAVKLAPQVRSLVHEIRIAIGKNPQVTQSMKEITDGTVQVSDATLSVLAPLLRVKP